MPRIKEIWCMPHSHLDIGYTHPQPMLLELQVDYLDQALDLCDATKDYPDGTRFCWTVEATYVLKKWLESADEEKKRRLREAVSRGQFCVTAMPFHTTPCVDANEMAHMFYDLDEIRSVTGDGIKIAINHDVNGQPWTMGQMLLDCGVDFYLTGINTHFGGIPMPRPAPFLWETADKRRLLTFVGEHYSLFSQFLFTWEHSTARMHEGASDYADWLEQKGYSLDFAFLTATNPPLFDNNCPDLQLPDMIREYNAEGHEFTLRLVTANDLRKRIMKMPDVPVMGGDWTDYWNFGAGSTAKETRVCRLAKAALRQSEVVDSFKNAPDKRRERIRKACMESALVYDEHTWGASQSVTQPDSFETSSQYVHKIKKAYEAADLAGYLLGSSLEALADNPHQANELGGVLVVNTSAAEQTVELNVSKFDFLKGRQLAALRIKTRAPYLTPWDEKTCCGLVTVPPFTAKRIPHRDLTPGFENNEAITVEPGMIETPFYRVTLDNTGTIIQITDKKTGRDALDKNSGFALFEPIRETIDEEKDPQVRATFFPRDVNLGNHSISQWNHTWAAKREKAVCTKSEIIRESCGVTVVTDLTLDGVDDMQQRVTFYTYQRKIRMIVCFKKEPVATPESVCFALPLKMAEGWQCSYDTAGALVRLDDDQLGTVCRDYVTVDTAVSVYDGSLCATLACPDAPLVQVGGFNFGKESRHIERNENPLLIAWALNNYWDTNFCANQSGAMTFAYELNLRESFNPKTAMFDGISAQEPVKIGVSVAPVSGERALISYSGESVILHVYPEDSTGALRVLVTNPTAKPDKLILSLPEREITSASVISPSGAVLSPCAVADGAAAVTIPSGAVRLIRIEAK